MQNTQPRGSANGAMRSRLIQSLALAVLLLAALAALQPPDAAEAACCVCRGGGCGDGFCADAIANLAACGNLCGIAGCPNGLFDPQDVCAGGCDVASALPTATPTATVNTPTNTPSLTPSLTPTQAPTNTATRSIAPTPATCCQRVQACSIALVPGVCGPGEEVLIGGLCVTGPPRPVGEPTVSMCALPTPTITQTGTPTITLTPTNTLPPTPTLTETPANTVTLTATATLTSTPRATDTAPPAPTPAICCQNGSLCDDTKGQNFATGPICLPGGGAANIPLTPVPYSSCMRNIGCIPFTPTGTFTATPVNTGTFTMTPTVTPTPAIPSSIDPYKCYRIKDTSPIRLKVPEVKLVDRFGGTRSAVLKPFLLCNPAIESNLTQTPGTHGDQVDPAAHTVCFKIRDRNSPQRVPGAGDLRVMFKHPTEGAFTTIKPEFGKSDLLCMPAAFVDPTPQPPRPCTAPTQCPQMVPTLACFEGFCRDLRTPTPTATISF